MMIVQDIVTSGGQTLETAQVIHSAAIEVARIMVVIDRQEYKRKKMEAADFTFQGLMAKSEPGTDEKRLRN